MNSARLELRPQWVGWLEAMYAQVPDERAWADGVLAAAGSVFGSPDRCGMMIGTYPSAADTVQPRLVAGAGADAAARLPVLGPMGVDAVRLFFFPPGMVATHGEFATYASDDQRALLAEVHERYGVADAVGLVIHPEPGLLAVLYLVSPQEVVISAHQRRRLTQAALDLEAALRVRVRPSSILAEILPDGRVAHLEPDGPAPGVLSEQVRRVERARSRRQRPVRDCRTPRCPQPNASCSRANREIARLRNRSVRTIANQVASLLRKTASSSRRVLVARGAVSLKGRS